MISSLKVIFQFFGFSTPKVKKLLFSIMAAFMKIDPKIILDRSGLICTLGLKNSTEMWKINPRASDDYCIVIGYSKEDGH